MTLSVRKKYNKVYMVRTHYRQKKSDIISEYLKTIQVTEENIMAKKNKILNVPNTLSLLRVILVPIFVAAIIFMRDINIWGRVIPMILFVITSLTDSLDGIIARKHNLVTDFGKFIDPLADKFMVFGALLSILYVSSVTAGAELFAKVFIWVALIIMFRELAVTSIRLVVAGKNGRVIAASWWGKIKTFSQCIAIIVFILNPLWADSDKYISSFVMCAIILVTTVGSGIDYFRAYLPLMLDKDE